VDGIDEIDEVDGIDEMDKIDGIDGIDEILKLMVIRLSKFKYIPFGAVMPRWKGLIKGCFSAVLMFSLRKKIQPSIPSNLSLPLILLFLPISTNELERRENERYRKIGKRKEKRRC
jgi:hypothetical protein